MEEVHHEPKWAVIRLCDIKVVSVGFVVSHDLELVVLRIVTLSVNIIRIRVNLVGMFTPYFRLLMEASLLPVWSSSVIFNFLVF